MVFVASFCGFTTVFLVSRLLRRYKCCVTTSGNPFCCKNRISRNRIYIDSLHNVLKERTFFVCFLMYVSFIPYDIASIFLGAFSGVTLFQYCWPTLAGTVWTLRYVVIGSQLRGLVDA
eukprot:TRINITY_DN3149_c0_g1_i1.p1 TRINITY_DN3149_c0_g1~~TRINITY_DN3149_c0_g1_i1.p1  ORF type:complete len:118 (+),score=1.08 TRINITY_DN3149_c0_g1_i1:262-615(+)